MVAIQHLDKGQPSQMKLFVFPLLFFLTACDISISIGLPNKGESLDKVTRVNIGGVMLDIPHAYMLPDLPPAMVPRTGDMDTESNSALFRIPLNHLGIDAETEEWPNTLSALISESSIIDLPVAPTLMDAWKAKGSYKNRVVEFDVQAELWRVYMTPTRRWTWLFFDKHPEEIKLNPNEAFIASCITSSREEGTLDNANCRRHIYYKNTTSDVSLIGKHFLAREKIYKAYLEELKK